MSRIGKKPVTIEEGVSASIADDVFMVKGPKGELSMEIPATVKVSVSETEIVIDKVKTGAQANADHGTVRALIANMVLGVKEGYVKKLQLVGMGYRVAMEGTGITMALGWNHPVKVPAPEGIEFSVEGDDIIIVSGIDKDKVGLCAANIRSIRKPEPYKGKGIRYVDEFVRRKASKSAKE